MLQSESGAVIPIHTGLPVESHGVYNYPSWLWPGSLVDELYEISEELASMFDWPYAAMDRIGRPRSGAAAWFVLTGEAPEVRPFNGRWEPQTSKHLNPQWRIKLTVPPWVPAEEVTRAYLLLRGQAPEGRRLPHTTTPLDVARFVWEQERLHGYKEPHWSALFKRWKHDNPETKIKTHNNFRTLFVRGAAAVGDLNFNWPRPRRAK